MLAHRLASVVGWVGRFAAVTLLVGCLSAPGARRTASNAAQARRQFSNALFCPAYRVSIARADEAVEAPAPIASDPERLKMWRAAIERKLRDEPRQTMTASGCGEQRTYECWEWPSPTEQGRHHRQESVGSSCNEIRAGMQRLWVQP